MLKKLVYTMGLLSAVSASTAMAVVDLDASPAAPLGIAKDVLTTTGKIDGVNDSKGTTYYLVSDSGTDIETKTKTGIGFAKDDQVFVRIDITNGAFATALTAAEVTLDGTAVTAVSKGGAKGESYAVVTTTLAAAIAQDDLLEFKPASIGVSGGGDVTLTFNIYTTLPDATNKTNSVSEKTGTYLTLKDVTVVTGTAGGETAEVSTNFTFFDTAKTDKNAPMGKIVVSTATSPGQKNDTSGAAAYTDAVDLSDATSKITFTGDFSFGTWYMDDDSNDCSSGSAGGTKLTVATDKKSATVAASGLAGGDDELCVEVDGKITIPKTDAYTYSLALKAKGTAFPFGTTTGTLGQIKHNGTTVEVPYLTTFSKYNQRLHIVNRGTSDADYSMTFTPEAGTTATAGTAASGTVKAGESAVVKATDAVTLTGKTRTAATLVIVAPAANIDVLSNQVNPETGSTDSVILD